MKLILQQHSRGYKILLNDIVLEETTHYGKEKVNNIFSILKKAFFLSGTNVQSIKQYRTPKKELKTKRVYTKKEENL